MIRDEKSRRLFTPEGTAEKIEYLKSLGMSDSGLIAYYEPHIERFAVLGSSITGDEVELENAYFHILADRCRERLGYVPKLKDIWAAEEENLRRKYDEYTHSDKTAKLWAPEDKDRAFFAEVGNILYRHMGRFIEGSAARFAQGFRCYDIEDAIQDIFIMIETAYLSYDGLKGRLYNLCEAELMRFQDHKSAVLNGVTKYYNQAKYQVKKAIEYFAAKGINNPTATQIKARIDSVLVKPIALSAVNEGLKLLNTDTPAYFDEAWNVEETPLLAAAVEGPEETADYNELRSLVQKALKGVSKAGTIAFLLNHCIDMESADIRVESFSKSLTTDEIGCVKVFVDAAEREGVTVIHGSKKLKFDSFAPHELDMLYMDKYVRKSDVDLLVSGVVRRLSNSPAICEYAGRHAKSFRAVTFSEVVEMDDTFAL